MQAVSRSTIVAIAVGGAAATLGLYWDDAWHTDRGRDTFFSPPHLLLYAGVIVLLGVAAVWAWQRISAEGATALRDPLLGLPLVGAAVTLAAAPVDELWHELFGRDAVVWSPPHMVAVAGMLAFAVGLLAVVRRSTAGGPLLVAVVGAFVMAAAVTPVMEFEADVPQFPVVWYWPVVVGTLTFAFALIRRGSRRSWAAMEAAGVYVVLRLVIVGFLAVLDHSLPTVMPTVLAAGAFDLSVRLRVPRSVVAVATTVATVASHATAHAVQPAGLTFRLDELLLGGLLAIAAAWVTLCAVGVATERPRRPRWVGVGVVVALLVVLVVWPTPAFAHDPGQGDEIAPVRLAAERDGDGIAVQVVLSDVDCRDVEPARVLARRAGRAYGDVLRQVGPCRFEGHVRVDDRGRWFVYAELVIDGELTEAWIAVDQAQNVKHTALYAAPESQRSTFQVVAGTALYLIVSMILGATVWAYRRSVLPHVTAD